MRRFFADLAATGGWKGGWCRMLATLDRPGASPADSPWRREQWGALWDVGPHALSNLSAMLGPVVDLTAVSGADGLIHLVLTHESGASSTASVSLSAPPAGSNFETGVWGESGTALLPERTTPPADAFQLAAEELVAAAESGESHPVDVAFGARLVDLLASAQQQLTAGR